MGTKQLTFPFYDDALVDGRLSEHKWTKIKPDQWVRTTYTEKWTTESHCGFGGVGYGDEPILEHHSREVVEVWAVRLLPVLVSPNGLYVKFPYQFETIEKIDGNQSVS
jgi:hypothetical protein